MRNEKSHPSTANQFSLTHSLTHSFCIHSLTHPRAHLCTAPTPLLFLNPSIHPSIHLKSTLFRLRTTKLPPGFTLCCRPSTLDSCHPFNLLPATTLLQLLPTIHPDLTPPYTILHPLRLWPLCRTAIDQNPSKRSPSSCPNRSSTSLPRP